MVVVVVVVVCVCVCVVGSSGGGDIWQVSDVSHTHTHTVNTLIVSPDTAQ